ncbi:hypothetical protein ACEQ8H_001683 [Pleosporales sp. CAS-2024a]
MPKERAPHARLHKRAHSASSMSMTSPPCPPRHSGSFAFSRSETPRTTYEEPWTEPQRPMPAAAPSHPLKIKPYLRKLSSKEQSHGLDLSRPAAENEGLAGLGIAEYRGGAGGAGGGGGVGGGGYSRSITDITFAPVNSRNRHARSTSNTSQFSTSSGGLQRPTPLPPIRHAPQAYLSSPMSASLPPSILDSDKEADDIMSDDDFRLRQNAYDPSRCSASLSSAPGTSLRIHTNNSSTRLAASYSQSSVSLTSPTIVPERSRGDTLMSLDTPTSPSSRTSFDHATRFIRGGRDSPIDAASRAASIRAAREKFEADQRAKEAKYEKEAHKAAEREARKQQKKDEQRSETHDRRRMDALVDEKASRPSVGGRQYSDHRRAHSNSLPNYVTSVDREKQSDGAVPIVTKRRKAKGRWLRFVTWFKTRLLRMRRGF